MALLQQLQDDMKTALKAGDKPRLGVIRMAIAAIKQRQIDDQKTLDDAGVLAVIEKMVKQRKDSESQYREAGRNELADQEAFEIEVLQTYLPQPLSEAELDALIAQCLEETGASSMKDMGKVMGLVKQKAQGRADMQQVSARVKAALGS